MITISRYYNLAEANLAKELLESNNVKAFLADAEAFALGQQYAPEGIRLQVAEADSEHASRLLEELRSAEPLPDDFDPGPPPEDAKEKTAGPKYSNFGAFTRGGLVALIAFLLLAVFTVLIGGSVRMNLGGVLVVFILGGCGGLLVRYVFMKGYRKGKKG